MPSDPQLSPTVGRTAFTLVELLIAIALSLAVVATATAAFTMTAKVVGHSEAISRQNQAIREVYLACVEDADFWWSTDDAFAATGRPYRTPTGGTGDNGHGNPFVPLDLPDDYWNWRVAEPRGWQRTGAFRDPASDGGRNYALLGRIGDSDPNRAWSHGLTDQVFQSLGLFGLDEYLHPGWQWWYALSTTNQNSFGDTMTPTYGSVPRKLIDAPAYLRDGIPYVPTDRNGSRIRHTHHGFLGTVPRPDWAVTYNAARNPTMARLAAGAVNDSVNFLQAGRRIDWGSEQSQWLAIAPHVRARPAGWPIVRGGLLRTVNAGGRAAVIDIALIDEISGQRTTYNFQIISSSLRGARQQRDWPHWNPTNPPLDR